MENNVIKQIELLGVVPVIAIDDADQAIPLAKALINGGLPAAEVTFRTAAGEESIRRMAREFPDMLVGAGTVLNVEQCKRAVDAGAKFIVSPGYNDELVAYCVENDIPVLPGCVDASQMTKAVNAGLSVVKFFPAEQSGGINTIKALAPVFPKLRFMPTGGVNTKNLMDYLGFSKIIACGGTWMVKKDLINGEKWDEISALCREAVQKVLGFNLMHVGINCQDADSAASTASEFDKAFGFAYKAGNSSDFAGSFIECMKGPGKGANGHIAIGTYSVERAEAYLKRLGYEFDESTRKLDASGNTKAVYLASDISGFAVHLVQR